MKGNIGFWRIFHYVIIIADIHFIFHNFFILYAMHVLDSGEYYVSVYVF
jgi:hypothetical protein